jgi:hypothetical protein
VPGQHTFALQFAAGLGRRNGADEAIARNPTDGEIRRGMVPMTIDDSEEIDF